MKAFASQGVTCTSILPWNIYAFPFEKTTYICVKIATETYAHNTGGLTHSSLENPKRAIGKQCRLRSDATECGVWSRSPLFVNSLAICLYLNLIAWHTWNWSWTLSVYSVRDFIQSTMGKKIRFMVETIQTDIVLLMECQCWRQFAWNFNFPFFIGKNKRNISKRLLKILPRVLSVNKPGIVTHQPSRVYRLYTCKCI